MYQIQMLPCKDELEWARAKYFRQKYFFAPNNIEDPYTWTFNHPSHEHFLLYFDTKIIGYVHIQLWQDMRAAIRIIVIEEAERNNNYGRKFLQFCESHLKSQGYKSIHAESSVTALNFYKKNGYVQMPFNDPDGYESDPSDIAMGKIL